MKCTNTFLTSIGLFVFLGCASVPPPERTDVNASIIGIKVKIRAPLMKVFGTPAEIVYFVRTDREDPLVQDTEDPLVQDTEDLLVQDTLIPSNYASGGYLYLLNAPPGRYSAVVASYTAQSAPMGSTASLGGGFSVSTSVSYSAGIMTYFPSDAIEKTLVTVEPSSVAFMGEFVLDRALSMNDADEAQMYYYRQVAPGAEDRNFLLRGPHFKGSLHAWDRDEDARREFLAHTEGRLAESGWASIFQAPVASAPPE
jgi:hypothetical protein